MQSEHLVIHVIGQHLAVKGKQMRSQNECKDTREKQRDRDANEVHNTNAFVVERKGPGLPAF